MNLQDFIDLRSHCPMCGTALITKLDANRKQKSRIENDRHVSIMTMRGMGVNDPDYEVGYSFGPSDYSLGIEFYNEWNTRDHHTLHMIKIFKEFHNNISKSEFRFLRTCGFCFKYEMRSFRVDLDLKSARYGSITPATESFVFVTQAEEEFKFVRLDNHLEWNTSDLWWWRNDMDYRLDWPLQSNCSHRFELPFIPFVSKEETGRRLNNLITFS